MIAEPILNTEKYTQLLAKTIPMVITSEQDSEPLLKEVEVLFDKSMKQELSSEEDTIFELLLSISMKKNILLRLNLTLLECLSFLWSNTIKSLKIFGMS